MGSRRPRPATPSRPSPAEDARASAPRAAEPMPGARRSARRDRPRHRRAAAGLQPQHRLGQLRQRGAARAHRAGVGLGGAGVTGHAGLLERGSPTGLGEGGPCHPRPAAPCRVGRVGRLVSDPSPGGGLGGPAGPTAHDGSGHRARRRGVGGAGTGVLRAHGDLPGTVAAERGSHRGAVGVSTHPEDDMSRDRPTPFPRTVSLRRPVRGKRLVHEECTARAAEDRHAEAARVTATHERPSAPTGTPDEPVPPPSLGSRTAPRVTRHVSSGARHGRESRRRSAPDLLSPVTGTGGVPAGAGTGGRRA